MAVTGENQLHQQLSRSVGYRAEWPYLSAEFRKDPLCE